MEAEERWRNGGGGMEEEGGMNGGRGNREVNDKIGHLYCMNHK